MQGYGMTELSGCVTYLPPYYHTPEGRALGKLRSAGRAAPVAEVKIVDADGREVPRGTVGEIAARGMSVMTGLRISCSFVSHAAASTSATNAPVIDAVRVPPSAWMTSQSIQIVRSPSDFRSTTERRERPTSRWISIVRPPS